MAILNIRPRYPFLNHVLFFGILGLSFAREFEREICYNKTQTMLAANTSMAMDTSIFVTHHGQLMSNATDPWLTIPACNQICGSQMGFYSDTPSRLLTWLIPTILLITNMKFAPLGNERFLIVLHVFGDPIDSFYSLLSKMETWNRWSQSCRGRDYSFHGSNKYVAIIMPALEEVILPSHIDLQPDQASACSCIQPQLEDLYRESAINIVDSRTHGTAQTCFSIVLYVVGIASAFIDALGGSSGTSGGKLAPAMLLSWLLMVILVSNVVGQFNSSHNCLQIILRLKERILHLEHAGGCSKSQSPRPDWIQYLESPNWEEHLNSLPWSGGMYSFRLHNRLPEVGERHSWKLLAFTSILPALISAATAFSVLYSAPTYFSCRHFIVISAFVSWLLSPIITWSIANTHFLANDKTRFYLVLLKDTVIGVPILFLLIASSCGLFNNCYCWSGILTLGSRAAVVLNPAKQFARNDKFIYPATVAASLFLQLCVFLWVLWIGRAGLGMMRMRERERRAALIRNQPSTIEELQSLTPSIDAVTKVPGRIDVLEGWDGASCIV
jgi:hypothetical protein